MRKLGVKWSKSIIMASVSSPLTEKSQRLDNLLYSVSYLLLRILYKFNLTSHILHLLFSFRNQTSHFLPLQVLHVAVITVYGLDFNNSVFGLSAGSESYLVCARSCYY